MCLGRSIGYKEQLAAREDTLYLSFQEDDISALQFLKMKQNEEKMDEKLHFTGWYNKAGQIVCNEELCREKSADVIYIIGDSNPIVDTIYPLMGDDNNGCVISSSLSYDLFGSMNGRNRIIQFEDRNLLVRDVYDYPDNLLFVQAEITVSEEEEQRQEAIEGIAVDIDTDNGKGKNTIYNIFLARYHIESAQMADTMFIKWLGTSLTCLLPVCCILYLIFLYGKKGIENKQKPFYCGYYLLMLLFWMLVLIWIIDWPGLTKEMIPTKWSDFGFLVDMWEDYQGQIGYIIEKGSNFPYCAYGGLLKSTTIFSLLSSGLLGLFLGIVRLMKISNMFLLEVFIIIFSYIIFIDLNQREILMVYSKMYYLFPVFYLLAVNGSKALPFQT